MIFCLDPAAGISGACGVALFTTKGALSSAGIVRPEKVGDRMADAYSTASAVAWWVRQHGGGTDLVDVFVTEWPQVYPQKRSPGNPNKSVLPLCNVAAHVSGLLGASCKRVSYCPHEWKGSIDADEFTRRVLERLTAEESARFEEMPARLKHNAADAVGLGLKYFDRLDRRVIHRD